MFGNRVWRPSGPGPSRMGDASVSWLAFGLGRDAAVLRFCWRLRSSAVSSALRRRRDRRPRPRRSAGPLPCRWQLHSAPRRPRSTPGAGWSPGGSEHFHRESDCAGPGLRCLTFGCRPSAVSCRRQSRLSHPALPQRVGARLQAAWLARFGALPRRHRVVESFVALHCGARARHASEHLRVVRSRSGGLEAHRVQDCPIHASPREDRARSGCKTTARNGLSCRARPRSTAPRCGDTPGRRQAGRRPR